MSNDNTESISDKLRRWTDTRKHSLPFEAALWEFEIEGTDGLDDQRKLFRHIADEVDAEKRAITELYARQSWMNPADAIAKLATGEIEWAELQQAIERYYLPRPLFEDGEPVQFGDEIEHPDSGKTCSVNSIHVFENGYVAMSLHRNNTCAVYESGECVKRPKPQVLDADGVPIMVGDKVWMLPGEHCETFPLYGYKAGVEYTVSENESASHKENGRICITGGDCACGYPMPEQVTHREPDTQERIDDDVTVSPFSYCVKHGLVNGYHEMSEATELMVRDLLRRQRELDNREGK